jgi:hypothetical protein
VEPITISLVVSALAAAATNAAEGVAGQAVQDAYNGLKSLLQERFGENQVAQTTLSQFEKDPETWETPLKKQIEETGAAQDPEVRDATVRLQEALRTGGVAVEASGSGSVAAGGGIAGAATGERAVAAGGDISGPVTTGDDNVIGEAASPKKVP